MDIEGLIYRIICGYYYININDETYKVFSPDIEIKQEAHTLYNKILSDHKFDQESWITQKDTEKMLKETGVWDSSTEKDLEILENRLEDMKIELYLKFEDPVMKRKIKSSIETGKKKINDMHMKKHSLDHLTLENYASSLKNEFIIINTVYLNGKKALDSDNVPADVLETFVLTLGVSSMSMESLRAVARSDLWKSYWDAAKGDIFPPPAYKWTDEQRLIVNLSKMYDSVREHTNVPDDNVIADDDALDGWMAFYRRKAEKERKKDKLMDAVGNKYKNAGEIFIVTNDQEQAKEIYSLNDAKGLAQIHHLKKISETQDSPTAWQDLPHVKAEIQSQIKKQQQLKDQNK